MCSVRIEISVLSQLPIVRWIIYILDQLHRKLPRRSRVLGFPRLSNQCKGREKFLCRINGNYVCLCAVRLFDMWFVCTSNRPMRRRPAAVDTYCMGIIHSVVLLQTSFKTAVQVGDLWNTYIHTYLVHIHICMYLLFALPIPTPWFFSSAKATTASKISIALRH